ncbi:hypothetical protein BsWGS_02519 [Bradybaena similaris]
MPKKKKRGVQKKKKDDSPGDVSECESLERLPSSKKVAAASSTSHLEDEVDQISSFTSMSLLNNSKSGSGDIAALSSSHFFCNYCEFSAESKSVLLVHMRQHMIKCPHCSFSSLSRIEVSRHCKHEHEEDSESVSQEVDSSSADCEMDKDPCTACVFCSFMTYSTEHLEKHTLQKHPGMLAKSVARMITKQNSMEVRRLDALFYMSNSNEGLAKSSGYNLIAPEKSLSPIVIDPVVKKSEDVKPEIKTKCFIKSSYSSEQTEQLKEQIYNDSHAETTVGEKMIIRNTSKKAGSSSGMPMQVKVETLYCLTCPYSSVYIEKLKCHTVVQHPVVAAVATYNSTGVDAEDISFFCVREECPHSSSDCTSYQKHLINCCSYQNKMKIIEKERLKSTITYILEHQRKYKLPAVDSFFEFASPFLDVCLPQTLTGISSSQAIHHRRAERLQNITQSTAMNAAQTVESSPLGLYKTPSHLSSTAVSSSDSSSTESNSSSGNQLFFPQQAQGIAQNIHSTPNNTLDYQSQMLHNPPSMPAQPVDCFSRNLPTDVRPLQPVQSHNIAFYPQNQGNYPQPSPANPQSQGNYPQPSPANPQSQGNYPQPSPANPQSQSNYPQPSPANPQSQANYPQPSPANPQSQANYTQPSPANSHVTSYPDTQQATVSWQTSQAQAANFPSVAIQSEQNYNNFPTQNNQTQGASFPSVQIQSEQNYNNIFPTQNLEVNNTTGFRVQSSTNFNPLNQSRSDSFSFGQNNDMNQSFMPAGSHGYAPSSGQTPQVPGNGPNMHINSNPNFPGQPSNTSVNNVSNVMMTSDAMAVSNPMTSNVFYGQQNVVSGVLNTTNINQSSVETQPLPKMVDLLSDSYSILLSDEFGPDGQMQQVADNSSFIQTHQAPVCAPPYQPEATLSTQSQAVVSQSLAVPQGQPVPYQSMQHEGSRFQQPAVDSSQLPSSQLPGNQFSFSVSNQNKQMAKMATSLGQNSGFQASQNSSDCEALQSALSSEEPSSAQTTPFQSSEVPNFLVSPGTPSSEMVPVQPHTAPSFNNRRPGTGNRGAGRPGTFTPPKNSQSGNKFAGASPLSPSIYLSGQVPRHRRSNWTDADMSPRGMMSGVRHVHPPVPAPGAPSYMNPRMFVPGRRGYPTGPRMSSGRGRMPSPRMPNSQIGSKGGDDDDVILTAVVRCTPPKNQQAHQQTGGRGAYRGIANHSPRGRGQAFPVQNRQRGQNSAPRMPYPVAAPAPHSHKQFDISKHFEDLACVVNATADDADGGAGDDIQILGVTPGKDKDKGSQPKAVDASKFSFCCVHCGKDQGSKTVMKQHMKARHNDSLLGAFTNTETGQLLFFCPQLNCEFMTYDEKRLSEHLPKCFDLDRSKPFDFGTAIKNLKSLKIRQLDVRTMGRSQENPIDLDGQGMKDNFSSSLNDAFGDIVVNASGRHMLRNAPPHQTRLSQPQFQSAPTQTAAMQSKSPIRNLPPSTTSTRPGHPRFAHQVNMGNRMIRPMPPFRYTKQSFEMRPHLRQTGPANLPMDARNVRDGRPRAPSSAAHGQPVRMAPPPNVTTPRTPSRSQQSPVVIVIDVDSPERPEEEQQTTSMVTESPEVRNESPVVSSGRSTNSSPLEALPLNIFGRSEIMNANFYPEQQSMADNPNLVPDHSASASLDLNPVSRDADDDCGFTENRTHASQLSSVIQRGGYPYDRSNTVDEAPEPDEDHLPQNIVTASGAMSTDSNSAAPSASQEDEPSSEYSPERPAVDSVSERIMDRSTSYSAEYAPAESSDGEAQMAEHTTDSSHGVPSCPAPSVTPVAHVNSYLSIDSTVEYFDEEEKVNALVLEKVFAKVPNMPKNLSRRLVAKFKEYAKHRGVKITTDSKVIDEFVSKIYYKGSAGDKAASRPQPTPEAAHCQSAEPPQAATSTPVAPTISSSSVPSSENDEPTHSASSPPEAPTISSNSVPSSEYDEPPHSATTTPEAPIISSSSVLSSENYEPTHAASSTSEAPIISSSSVPSSENDEPPHRDSDCESLNKYHDHNTAMVQKDLHPEEHAHERMTAVADPNLSEQTSANDGVATHVILAESSLHFSPKFASIAVKSSATSTKLLKNVYNVDVGQKRVETKRQVHAELHDSIQESDVNFESTTVLNRRNSLSNRRRPRFLGNLRRSGSLSHIVSRVPTSSGAAKLSQKPILEDVKIETSSSPVTADVVRSSEITPAVPPEDGETDADEPAAKTMEEQNLPVLGNDRLKEEVEIEFPPAPESETMPILISSSVADIVSGHPGLEVDIAGKPLKQELLEEDNEDIYNTYDDVSKDHSDKVVSPRDDMFEKVTPKSSIIDRRTGQLSLKKTKRGRPRKLFVEKEEKQQEEHKSFEAEEEHYVRRSSRSRKPVNKDYRSDANEIDELMSDDDDEYHIDEEDDDSDTDGDWRGGDSDQPPKKRIKKVVLPPDPTAFDNSTKGKFKCWLCKKMFSRCSFAKSHIIQKHKEGLCAVYMDKSEESKTLCLLVFCPRKCRYVTLNPEGLVNHIENCAETELEADGKSYLEINKGFLDNKFKELQGMSLEAVLSIPKARKPKDPTKVLKVKKSLKLNKSPAAGPVVIHHSEASVTVKGDSVVATMLSSSATTAASPAALQTVTSHRSHTTAHGQTHHPQPAVRSSTTTDHNAGISNKNFLPQKPTQHHSPQISGQHPSSLATDMSQPHYHRTISSPVSSPVAYKHPPGQQMFSTSEQAKAGSSSFPQPDLPRVPPFSTDQEDDIVYMIEDNGTICLK